MKLDTRMWRVLGCLLLFLQGCSGKSSQTGTSTAPNSPSVSPSTQSANTQAAPIPPPEGAKEPRVPMAGKKEAGKKASPPSQSAEEKPVSLDPLFGVPTQQIFPRDFELGTLKPVDPSAQEAMRKVEDFFARVQQGRSLKELLHPEYRWFLEEDLKQWEGKSISRRDLRFGVPSESPSGVIEVPFRILQEGRSLSGSILVEKKDDQWYVSDFLLDWDALASMEPTHQPAQKKAMGKERFDPFKE